jgi:hypothetical protein
MTVRLAIAPPSKKVGAAKLRKLVSSKERKKADDMLISRNNILDKQNR